MNVEFSVMFIKSRYTYVVLVFEDYVFPIKHTCLMSPSSLSSLVRVETHFSKEMYTN